MFRNSLLRIEIEHNPLLYETFKTFGAAFPKDVLCLQCLGYYKWEDKVTEPSNQKKVLKWSRLLWWVWKAILCLSYNFPIMQTRESCLMIKQWPKSSITLFYFFGNTYTHGCQIANNYKKVWFQSSGENRQDFQASFFHYYAGH